MRLGPQSSAERRRSPLRQGFELRGRFRRSPVGEQLPGQQKTTQRSNQSAHADCQQIPTYQCDSRPAPHSLQPNPWAQEYYGRREHEGDRGYCRRNVYRVEPHSAKSRKADQNDSAQDAQEPNGNDKKERHRQDCAIAWRPAFTVPKAAVKNMVTVESSRFKERNVGTRLSGV